MTKIKVPARIKQNQFDTLTQYFYEYEANRAKSIDSTNNTTVVYTYDGTAYWVKYVFKDFDNCYLHFRKAKKDKAGNITWD